MKTRLKKAKNKALLNKMAFATVAAIALFLYTIGVTVKPSWLTYGLQLPSLVIMALTALARVNDIGPDRKGWQWEGRRIAFSAAGAAAIALMFGPFSGQDFPSWRGLLLTWGVAGVWLTTPGMPPWDKYIMGKAKLPKEMT